MHNPKLFLDNERHKILWNFEIKTDHLISARRLDLMAVNKKKSVPLDRREKIIESKKRDKYLDVARELKKNREYEDDGDTNYNW